MANTLESKRKAWDTIFNDPNLSLNSLRHRAIAGTVCQNGLRSVCWKIFLGYLPSLEVSSWPALLLKERQRYVELKKKYIDEPTEKMNMKGEQDLSDNNPLALSDSNPWQQYFADTEIKKVIRQDVERTFPDVDFFRQEHVQERLTDILFIYCKLNLDVSYRQGMHELLAPFYWVLSLEALEEDASEPGSNVMMQVLDSAFVEHDAYILFEKLMMYGKSWYEFKEDVPSNRNSNKIKSDLFSNNNIPKPTDSARLNPVVMTCHRIHHEYLSKIDPILYRHLENFNIEPQLYGLRWIRLLFGREFDMYELLKLWDAIFAQDSTLGIVDYVCLAILLRMRDQLLQKDYAECLSLLMRPFRITKPASLVEQAKDLQENLSQDTALHILQQNDVRSGKEPRNSMLDGVPQQQPRPTIQHKSSQGFDSFSRLTNNMMKNPQVRDLNRAIAGVMGTVQKNVNTFGENMLGKENATFKRSSNASEFPSGINRIVTTHNKRQSVPPIPVPKDEPQQLRDQKMGELMAQCISILEKEIFENNYLQSSKQDKSNTASETQEDTQEEAQQEPDTTSEIVPAEDTQDKVSKDQEEEEEEEEEEDDDNEQQASSNEVNSNEANIIMALVGLKHVRDVLLGKQSQFDSNVIDIKTPSPTDSKEEWDIVDPKEVVYSPPKPTTSVFVPPAPITDGYEKEKPLPPITYIPTNPAPPKQHIKYRIEDLLSDPDLQLPSPKTTSNKFKWILEQEKNEKQDKAQQDNLFKNEIVTTTATINNTSPRKRSSFITNKKPIIDQVIESSTVDPLDAKNVDNRRPYEYDVL